jgi:cholesterol transport system auxiliary component
MTVPGMKMMPMQGFRNTRNRPLATALAGAAALALSGCVSLGSEVPESLLTLTAEAGAPVGSSAAASSEDNERAIAVLTPEVPAKLDVLRVPVNVSATEIAYLEDAIWVEKPARLFRRVLGETIRARSGENAPVVLDGDDAPLRAGTFLRGTLVEMGFDASAGEVVVRYDAIRTDAAGNAISRRFEAREGGVDADAASVAPALNRAANRVAIEVADWIMD